MLSWREARSPPPTVHVPQGFTSEAIAHMVVQVIQVKIFYCQSRKSRNILTKSLQILCASNDGHWASLTFRNGSSQTVKIKEKKKGYQPHVLVPEPPKKLQDNVLSTSSEHNIRKCARGTSMGARSDLFRNKKIQTVFPKHNVKFQTRPIQTQDSESITDNLVTKYVLTQCALDDKASGNDLVRKDAAMQTLQVPVQESFTNTFTEHCSDKSTQCLKVCSDVQVQTHIPRRSVKLQTRRICLRDEGVITDVANRVDGDAQTLCILEDKDAQTGLHLVDVIHNITQTERTIFEESVQTDPPMVPSEHLTTQTEVTCQAGIVQTNWAEFQYDSTTQTDPSNGEKVTQTFRPVVVVQHDVVQTDPIYRVRTTQTVRPVVVLQHDIVQTEPANRERTTQTHRPIVRHNIAQTVRRYRDAIIQTKDNYESSHRTATSVQTSSVEPCLTHVTTQTGKSHESVFVQTPPCVQNTAASVVHECVQTEDWCDYTATIHEHDLAVDVVENICVDREMQTLSKCSPIELGLDSMNVTTQTDWSVNQGTQTNWSSKSFTLDKESSPCTSPVLHEEQQEPDSTDETFTPVPCHNGLRDREVNDPDSIKEKRRHSEEPLSDYEYRPKKKTKTRHRSCGSLTYEPTFAKSFSSSNDLFAEDVRDADVNGRARLPSYKEPISIPLTPVERLEDPRVTKMMYRAAKGATKTGTSVYDNLVKHVLTEMFASGILSDEETKDIFDGKQLNSNDRPYSPSEEWDLESDARKDYKDDGSEKDGCTENNISGMDEDNCENTCDMNDDSTCEMNGDVSDLNDKTCEIEYNTCTTEACSERPSSPTVTENLRNSQQGGYSPEEANDQTQLKNGQTEMTNGQAKDNCQLEENKVQDESCAMKESSPLLLEVLSAPEVVISLEYEESSSDRGTPLCDTTETEESRTEQSSEVVVPLEVREAVNDLALCIAALPHDMQMSSGYSDKENNGKESQASCLKDTSEVSSPSSAITFELPDVEVVQIKERMDNRHGPLNCKIPDIKTSVSEPRKTMRKESPEIIHSPPMEVVLDSPAMNEMTQNLPYQDNMLRDLLVSRRNLSTVTHSTSDTLVNKLATISQPKETILHDFLLHKRSITTHSEESMKIKDLFKESECMPHQSITKNDILSFDHTSISSLAHVHEEPVRTKPYETYPLMPQFVPGTMNVGNRNYCVQDPRLISGKTQIAVYRETARLHLNTPVTSSYNPHQPHAAGLPNHYVGPLAHSSNDSDKRRERDLLLLPYNSVRNTDGIQDFSRTISEYERYSQPVSGSALVPRTSVIMSGKGFRPELHRPIPCPPDTPITSVPNMNYKSNSMGYQLPSPQVSNAPNVLTQGSALGEPYFGRPARYFDDNRSSLLALKDISQIVSQIQPMYQNHPVSKDHQRVDLKYSMESYMSNSGRLGVPREYYNYPAPNYDNPYYNPVGDAKQHAPSENKFVHNPNWKVPPGMYPERAMEDWYQKQQSSTGAYKPNDGMVDLGHPYGYPPVALQQVQPHHHHHHQQQPRFSVPIPRRRGRQSSKPRNDVQRLVPPYPVTSVPFGYRVRPPQHTFPNPMFHQSVQDDIFQPYSHVSTERTNHPVAPTPVVSVANTSDRTASKHGDIIYEACKIVFSDDPAFQEVSSDKTDTPTYFPVAPDTVANQQVPTSSESDQVPKTFTPL